MHDHNNQPNPYTKYTIGLVAGSNPAVPNVDRIRGVAPSLLAGFSILGILH